MSSGVRAGSNRVDVGRLCDAIVGGLVSGLIHEINNPLTTVIGFASEAATRADDLAVALDSRSGDAVVSISARGLVDDLRFVTHEAQRIATEVDQWRAAVKRDAGGLGEDLRFAAARAWTPYRHRARGKLAPAFIEVNASSKSVPWPCRLIGVDQIELFLLAYHLFLTLVEERGRSGVKLLAGYRALDGGALGELSLWTEPGGLEVGAPASQLAVDCLRAIAQLVGDANASEPDKGGAPDVAAFRVERERMTLVLPRPHGLVTG